ncbi:MAG: ISAs1 family transposase [Magnetococcales bacterium]|nr:ISAs1 family transposase [Magnetococcales bacterium]
MPFTLKKTIEFIVEEKKADFLFTVKGNQPTVLDTIAHLQLENGPAQFQTIERGHGRQETRSIWTSTRFVKYVPLPHIQQFFTIRRDVLNLKTGKSTTEFAYGCTSLPPERGSPAYLLSCNRGHWSIENSSHYVRDVTFDEDRSQIRAGHGPQMMACLRNLTIGLLRLAGWQEIASATREFAAKPWHALRFLGL